MRRWINIVAEWIAIIILIAITFWVCIGLHVAAGALSRWL